MKLEVIHKKPLTQFAQLLRVYERSLLHVTLVSPWIVAGDQSTFVPLIQVCASIRESGAKLTVISRPPKQEQHAVALMQLQAEKRCELYYMNDLHAKLYLARGNGIRIAMMGSANFTPSGDERNTELAIEVRSVRDSDSEAQLWNQLYAFATDVKVSAGKRVFRNH